MLVEVLDEEDIEQISRANLPSFLLKVIPLLGYAVLPQKKQFSTLQSHTS